MASRTAIRLGSARPSRAVLHSRLRRRPDLEVLEDRRLLAQIVVNNPTDSPVSGETDLRQAIAAAVSGDAITFDATVFATPQTITLGQANGQLEIETSLTITGPAAEVTVSGGGKSRVFEVDSGVTASLSGLTITGGSTGFGGGGVSNYGNVTLTGCTVSGNSAGEGGGVLNDGTAMLTSCTVSGNSASDGGGLNNYTFGQATLIGCTISGNTAGAYGGGLDITGELLIGDSIVAGNTAAKGPDISGGIADKGYNLIGNDAGGSGFTASTDQLNQAADLAPLGDYGGPTPTMPLLPGSPAIGTGTANGTMTDQRGLPLDSPKPDIGAFQTNPLAVNTTLDGVGSPSGDLSLRQAVNLADVLGAAATISFDPTAFSQAQTIILTQGQLELKDAGGAETITGPAAGLTISGGGHSRVFEVDKGVTASLSGLTITGGSAGSGGGVLNYGTVTLTGCTVSGNSAGDGGGLDNYTFGTATLTGCTISGNSSEIAGGGLDNGSGGTATLVGCTVSGNTAGAYGGGLEITGELTIGDSIVAGNTAATGPDVSGGISTDQGYNLIGNDAGGSGFTGPHDQACTTDSPIDPLLAPLGDYGGPTPTMPLLPGSPAIGTGAALGQTADQRGLPLDSPKPDIGAFQTNPLTVNTTLDGGGSPSGDLSLRQALNLADVLGAAATISFDPTAFSQAQTIILTQGQLELKDAGGAETITGPAAGLTISGGGHSRVFEVDKGVTASLSGLTITDGLVLGNGGGVLNYGAVSLTGCTISGNSASSGGGVSNYGTVTLTGCTVSGNSASDGGGVLNNGTVTLTGCTVSGNSASDGGGLDNYTFGQATLTGCTISGNTAEADGGGLDNGFGGTATLVGCTVSGNTAGADGGGLEITGELTIGDSIVAGNTAATGPDVSGGISTRVTT